MPSSELRIPKLNLGALIDADVFDDLVRDGTTQITLGLKQKGLRDNDEAIQDTLAEIGVEIAPDKKCVDYIKPNDISLSDMLKIRKCLKNAKGDPSKVRKCFSDMSSDVQKKMCEFMACSAGSDMAGNGGNDPCVNNTEKTEDGCCYSKYLNALCACAAKGFDISPGKTSTCLINAKKTLETCVAGRVDVGDW